MNIYTDLCPSARKHRITITTISLQLHTYTTAIKARTIMKVYTLWYEVLKVYEKITGERWNFHSTQLHATTKNREVFVRRDARNFPRHWFPSSIALVRNLPSQPGKAIFPVTGQDAGLLMRPEHSETKAKTETRKCETEIDIETETETKKLLWDRDQKLRDRDRDRDQSHQVNCMWK